MNACKACFGTLDKVFPMGKDGLREVPPECFDCPEKTACLKGALRSKEGISLRTELLERTPTEGVWGRFKRWSRKKELSRQVSAEERAKK